MRDRQAHTAQVRSQTVDAEARTFEVIFATEEPVERNTAWDGRFLEVLACHHDAVDMTRLEAGLSFLNSHKSWDMANRLGGVVPGSVRFESNTLAATIKLSRTEQADQLLSDLQDGIPVPISVGYKTLETQTIDGENGGPPTIVATRWQPHEISAVPVPADPRSKARNKPKNKGKKMSILDRLPSSRAKRERAETAAAEAERQAQLAEEAEQRAQIAAAEDRRVSLIRTLSLQHEQSDAFAKRHIEGGSTEAQFREALLDVLATEQERNDTMGNAQVTGHGFADGPGSQIEAASTALAARMNPSIELDHTSRHWQGASLYDHARASLERSGETGFGFSRNDIIKRALHSTSDFPILLANTAGKHLKALYDQQAAPLAPVFAPRTAPDFKTITTIDVSDLPALQRLNEGGEYKRGTLKESGETYSIATYGQIIGLTRQAIVNDDLGAFDRIPRLFSNVCTRLENDLRANLFVANALMADGEAFFSAAHGNLAPGAQLNADALSTATTMMRKQTTLQGEYIDLVPKFLVVGSENEARARKALAQISPAKTEDVNIHAGQLELLVDPRIDHISDTAWFIAADPASLAGVEFANLEGEEAPYIDQKVGWDVDGIEFKVRHDVGAGVVDFRPFVMNPGL
ncbi:MAG: prohead protease/major capsid protein fusion protein [Pseudomonadota bacterium]